MTCISTHPVGYANVTPDASLLADINDDVDAQATVDERPDLLMTRHVEIVRAARGMAVIETYVDNCLTAISEAFPVKVARGRASGMRAAEVIDHTAPTD